MIQLKAILLISAVVLLCGGFGEAKRTTVLDRFIGNFGYYILPVDRTAFTVDRPVWLMQIDIPKVFGYHPKSKKNIENVSTNVTLIETSKDGKKTGKQKKIFVGETLLHSKYEAIVKMPTDILLNPGFEYEIQMETPEDTHLMINETFKKGTMTIHRFFSKSIHVKFLQRNPNVKPPYDEVTKRKLSNGLVRRMHLKY